MRGQGRDKDTIILSLVRSNANRTVGSLLLYAARPALPPALMGQLLTACVTAQILLSQTRVCHICLAGRQ